MNSSSRHIISLFSLLVCLFLLNSCSKTVEPGKAELNVYIVGYEKNDSCYVAELWNNGAIIPLGDGKTSSYAEAITISSGDIYVAGKKGDTAGYWKNGAFLKLSAGNNRAEALDIFVSNGDVYVCGMEDSAAVIWENGSKTVLSNTGEKGTCVSGTAVNGDIYCAGTENGTAVFWKNSTKYQLGSTGKSNAYRIAVSGSNVYISGREGDSAAIWKNGIKQILWRGCALGLYLDGNDVYTSGYYIDEGYFAGGATLCKNGNSVSFSGGSSGLTFNSVFVSGGKIYCSGADANWGRSMAVFLSNGNVIYLTSGLYQAAARDIFVQ